MAVFIYGLFCPYTDDLRYIGKSVDPDGRLRRHIESARTPQNYNQRWIATLLRDGVHPVLRILREVADCEDWRVVERAMIADARAAGARLTNTASGGEGVVIDDPAVERQRRLAIRAAWSDPALREEQSKRVRVSRGSIEARTAASETTRQLWQDPQYAEKVSGAVRAAYSTPKARAAQAERARASHCDPEAERRRARAISAAWDKGDRRKKHSEAIRQVCALPEVKARKSQAMRERLANPDEKARMMRGLSDPEMIKRRNEAIRAGWARRLTARKD